MQLNNLMNWREVNKSVRGEDERCGRCMNRTGELFKRECESLRKEDYVTEEGIGTEYV